MWGKRARTNGFKVLAGLKDCRVGLLEGVNLKDLRGLYEIENIEGSQLVMYLWE